MQHDSREEIRAVAMELDNALERHDEAAVLTCFSDDCAVELLGVTLRGKRGVKRWMDWLYEHLAKLSFTPVNIVVQGDTLFEEFVLHATLKDGNLVDSKQAEVLTIQDRKIRSLRIYFDRLDFAEAVATNFVARNLANLLINRSVQGLA